MKKGQTDRQTYWDRVGHACCDEVASTSKNLGFQQLCHLCEKELGCLSRRSVCRKHSPVAVIQMEEAVVSSFYTHYQHLHKDRELCQFPEFDEVKALLVPMSLKHWSLSIAR